MGSMRARRVDGVADGGGNDFLDPWLLVGYRYRVADVQAILDAGKRESGERFLGAFVPGAGVAVGLGAGGSGGFLGVIPPGVAECGLFESVDGGGEFLGCQGAEHGVRRRRRGAEGRSSHWPLCRYA